MGFTLTPPFFMSRGRGRPAQGPVNGPVAVRCGHAFAAPGQLRAATPCSLQGQSLGLALAFAAWQALLIQGP